MIIPLLNILLLLLQSLNLNAYADSDQINIRVNQLGYLPDENKVAVAFSRKPIRDKFLLISAEGESTIASLTPKRLKTEGWGTFRYYYDIDFSHIESPARYVLRGRKSECESQEFAISVEAYRNQPGNLLVFMRQQRCGYNPFLDMFCHQHDGRSMFGPMPDSTYVDASGGWPLHCIPINLTTG
jgi:hypothetical protein